MSIKMEFQGKTYVWRCQHHKVDLIASGHSRGMGMECWPGMSFDYDEGCWHPDSSELACPIEMALQKEADEDVNEVDEIELCDNDWSLVEILPLPL